MRIESEYHTKAEKTRQNRWEWYEEYHEPREEPYSQDPYLESYRNADKSSILIPMNSPHGSPQHEYSSQSAPDYQNPSILNPNDSYHLESDSNLRFYREQKVHHPLRLQDFDHAIGHATNTDRIQWKISTFYHLS